MANDQTMGRAETATYTDDGQHRIPLAQARGPIELELSNSSGETAVRAGNGPDGIVRFTKNGGRGNDGELLIVTQGSRIKIAPRSLGGRGGFLSGILGDRGASFDIEVELPRERLTDGTARVRVRSASGDVQVAEVSGELRVNTASGDAHVADATGQITLQAASGDMHLTRARGQVTVHTASGDIQVDDGVLSRFAVASASGDTRLSGQLTGNEASRVETVSGDVWLALVSPPGTEIHLMTVSGDGWAEAPYRQVGSRTWRLGDTDGGPTISIKTVSGDLHVQGSEATGATEPIPRPAGAGETAPIDVTPPAPPEPPTPPAPPSMPDIPNAPWPQSDAEPPTQPDAAPADASRVIDEVHQQTAADPLDETERLTVLQALERGEIDIDEAMSRLDEMDEPISDGA